MSNLQLTDIPFFENTNLMRNPDLVLQGYDYNGFENGLIHPSDADIEWEFNNQFYITGEIKFKGNVIPEGQDWLIRRKVDAWMDKNIVAKQYNEKLEWKLKYYKAINKDFTENEFLKMGNPKRKSIAFKLIHETSKTDKFVVVKNCRVEQFYYKGKWRPFTKDELFIDTFNRLGHEWGIEKIIKSQLK